MKSDECLHIPRGAVPDVTGLKPSQRLLEVTAEGLAHFLSIGCHTLGSLDSGSQRATGGRAVCPVTKVPKRLCRKETNVMTVPDEKR